jgi:microcompartment protein CcmL/EutN
MNGPALGFVELESIARGLVVADALVKRAPVRIAMAEPVTPGKFALLYFGGVAEVDESHREALAVGGSTVLDKLLLPQAARGLVAALEGKLDSTWRESIGLVETHTIASALLAADTALKRADVWLTRLMLAKGIGGKGYFTLSGSLHMVQEAVEGAASAIEPSLLVATEVIQQPHSDLKKL